MTSRANRSMAYSYESTLTVRRGRRDSVPTLDATSRPVIGGTPERDDLRPERDDLDDLVFGPGCPGYGPLPGAVWWPLNRTHGGVGRSRTAPKGRRGLVD